MRNQSLDDLNRCTGEPGPQAWEAFKRLATLGTEAALSLLLDRANHPDWTIRQAAINALAQHRLGCQAEPILRTAMKDPSEYVVRAALNASRELRLISLNEVVAALVKDRNPLTRAEAMRTIGRMWTSGNFVLVYAAFSKDSDEEVRKEAAWSLYHNAGKDTWRTLYGVWIAAAMPRYRLWAVELVSRFGGESDVAALSSLSGDPDGHVRKAVANVLASAQREAGER